jgi:hypothetical protein
MAVNEDEFITDLIGILDSFHDYAGDSYDEVVDFIIFINKITDFMTRFHQYLIDNSAIPVVASLLSIYYYLEYIITIKMFPENNPNPPKDTDNKLLYRKNYINTEDVRTIMLHFIVYWYTTKKGKNITTLQNADTEILKMFTNMVAGINPPIKPNHKFIINHRNLIYYLYKYPKNTQLLKNICKIFNINISDSSTILANINTWNGAGYPIVTYPISDIDDAKGKNSYYTNQDVIKYTITNKNKADIDGCAPAKPALIIEQGEGLLTLDNIKSIPKSTIIANNLMINIELNRIPELITFNHLNCTYSYNNGIRIRFATIDVTFHSNNAGGRGSNNLGLLNLADVCEKVNSSTALNEHEITLLKEVFAGNDGAVTKFISDVNKFVTQFNTGKPVMDHITFKEVIIYISFGAKRFGDWSQQNIGKLFYIFVESNDFYCKLYGIFIGAPVLLYETKRFCTTPLIRGTCSDLYNIEPTFNRLKEKALDKKFPLNIVDNYTGDANIMPKIIINADSAIYIKKYLKYKYKYLKLKGIDNKLLLNNIKNVDTTNIKLKYLKYKEKYIRLLDQLGSGASTSNNTKKIKEREKKEREKKEKERQKILQENKGTNTKKNKIKRYFEREIKTTSVENLINKEYKQNITPTERKQKQSIIDEKQRQHLQKVEHHNKMATQAGVTALVAAENFSNAIHHGEEAGIDVKDLANSAAANYKIVADAHKDSDLIEAAKHYDLAAFYADKGGDTKNAISHRTSLNGIYENLATQYYTISATNIAEAKILEQSRDFINAHEHYGIAFKNYSLGVHYEGKYADVADKYWETIGAILKPVIEALGVDHLRVFLGSVYAYIDSDGKNSDILQYYYNFIKIVQMTISELDFRTIQYMDNDPFDLLSNYLEKISDSVCYR